MNRHQIVDETRWLEARRALLEREKEFTRLRDELNEERRKLPWVRITQDYRFTGATGEVSLDELFGGCSQLMVYHFMFHPDWDNACKSCSFWADGYNGFFRHLAQRDVQLVAVSRAPWAKLEAFAGRMGWQFPWYSSEISSFNHDYNVSFTPEEIASGSVHYNFRDTNFTPAEAPGLSVFTRNEVGEVFRTYSCYARGLDMLNGAYHHLDLVPAGRDEAGLPFSMAWVNFQDSYG
jgi:predicted dithiol-disulfide oxidoreductase (DUF899 family)